MVERSAVSLHRNSQMAAPVRNFVPLSALIKRRSGPSRCLFGAPDKEESIAYATNEIKSEQDRLSSKYNFDFENCSPLAGKFQYENISNQDRVSEIVEKMIENTGEESESQADSEKTLSQKNLTQFYTISRKRQCPFKDEIEESLTTKKVFTPRMPSTTTSRHALQTVN